MKKKFLIVAGIVFTVFVILLIAICGAAGSNKVVTKEELKTRITNVTCEVKDKENITYDLETITNDIRFDNEIKSEQYKKIIVNKETGFKSLGVTFIAKSNKDFTLEISLNKNGNSLKSTTITFENEQTVNVNLILDESCQIDYTDIFTITFEQTTNYSFTFDTLIFFFDEV